MSDNSRDTQFKKFSDLLQREQIAISYQGFVNNWNSVDIERRQRENIARRAYDLVSHTVQFLDPETFANGINDADIIPDMTELPKEPNHEQ